MENVGSKIKTLVAVITILGLIACVILFIAGSAAYNEDKDYIEYATVYGGAYGYPSLQKAGDNAYAGLQMKNMALPLALCILIGALPLYGFGVLVESSEQQTTMLVRLSEEQRKTNELLKKIQEKSASAPVSSAPEVVKSASSYLPEL